MKVKSKIPMIITFVMTVSFFLLWAAFFLVALSTRGAEMSMAILSDNLLKHVQTIGKAFESVALAFSASPKFIIESWVMACIAFVFLGLIIAGIIICAKKRKGFYIFYILMMILVLAPAFDLTVYLMLDQSSGGYIANMKVFASDFTAPNSILSFSFYVLFISFGALAFIMCIATYIVGLVGIVNGVEKQAEVPAIAEKADEFETFEIPAEEEPVEAPANEIPAEEVAVVEVPNEEPVEAEPEMIAEPEIEEEQSAPAQVETPVEEPVETPVPETPVVKPAEEPLTSSSLAAMLKEVVRDIVRDELARTAVNQPAPAATPVQGAQTITGATFGGPLVVQYFNGGINGVTPAAPAVVPAPAPVAAPTPAPEAPAPAPVVAPAPAVVAPVVAKPVVEEKKPEVKAPEASAEPKKSIERIPFPVRLLAADKEIHDNYNEIKNEILSWGVKSRVSNAGDTFRLHTKTYIKLIVAGKSLKLYFALDPKDYKDSTIPVLDAGDKNLYQDIPLVFKVKSGLSMRRCKQLIQDCMEKDGLEQKEIGTVNWIKELKAEMNASKKTK